MRCTRCDRIAVPQALGVTPDDQLVFGWCVPCLKEVGCTEIVVAGKAQVVKAPLQAKRGAEFRDAASYTSAERRRGIALVGRLLSCWALILVFAGAWLSGRPRRSTENSLGNGSPVLMFVGGLGSMLLAWVLLSAAVGSSPARSASLYRRFAAMGLIVATIMIALRLGPSLEPCLARVLLILVGASGLSVAAGYALRKIRERNELRLRS